MNSKSPKAFAAFGDFCRLSQRGKMKIYCRFCAFGGRLLMKSADAAAAVQFPDKSALGKGWGAWGEGLQERLSFGKAGPLAPAATEWRPQAVPVATKEATGIDSRDEGFPFPPEKRFGFLPPQNKMPPKDRTRPEEEIPLPASFCLARAGIKNGLQRQPVFQSSGN